MEATTSTRMTADERREAILVAAAEEFALCGLHGASTDAIARRAGISQPYLFRLFGTKKELYIASARRCLRLTLETFQRAAEGTRGAEALRAIGEAYGRLVAEDPTMLQFQLQGYAASCEDGDIRQVMKDGYGDLVTYVERVSGAEPARIARFFATGMLLNVIAAMGLDQDPEPWAQRLLAGCRDVGES
jgi:AcrR family transcriptional regulator